MLSFLPSFILAPIAFCLFCLNLAFCGSLVFLGGLIKLLLPSRKLQLILLSLMHAAFKLWALNNYLILTLINPIEWQITGDTNLHQDHWYLLIANHYSWLDIMVIANFARTRIPMPKFFLKDSLKKVPFLGLACWALDMPFMKRYSKSFIEKHPELKGKDIETTRKSCQHFQYTPTTIVNFVEGTRFTPEKHQQQQSSLSHLLKPKAAGIAFTLAALENRFDKILNVTLVYPNNRGHVMKDALSGKLTKVIIDVEQIEISENLVGDYFTDDNFKFRFQNWLNQLWQSKDKRIGQHLSDTKQNVSTELTSPVQNSHI